MAEPDPAVQAAHAAAQQRQRRIAELMDEIEAELRQRGAPPPMLAGRTVSFRVELPEEARAQLLALCLRTRDRPSDVIVDAVRLHLDALEDGRLREEAPQ